MAATHTPGKLRVIGKIYDDVRVVTDANMPKADHSYGDQTVIGSSELTYLTDADARRLVACWNACEGLSTEAIEGIAADGNTVSQIFRANENAEEQLISQRDHFQALAKDNGQTIIKTACELAEVKAQRDALLATLREAESRLSLLVEREQHKLLDIVVRDSARAAIAQANSQQGGAA